jgi:hydroxymethylpyrimidine/phosphomethylpyrimidine kinase
MAAHGLWGVTALTALTVQSTQGIRRVAPVEGALLGETLQCLGDNFGAGPGGIAGVKVGMLATAGNVGVVAAWLRGSGIPRDRVVLDPVLRSSSGAELLEPDGVSRLIEDLLPATGWVTPNVDELAILSAEPVSAREAVPAAARKLARQVPGLNIVVTGGHLEPPDDCLLAAAGQETWFPGKHVDAQGIHGAHGTGCAFSTALLCGLLLGDSPEEAVRRAKAWVLKRLQGD